MKKTLTLLLAVAMAAMMFAACSTSYKDGTYKASYKNPSHGWTEYVEVTVSGGKITAVDFDALNEAGDRKSENQEYEDSMKGAGATTGPMEFYKGYEDALIEKQDVTKVDAIASATHSGESLKELVKALEKNMKSGTTDEVIVENAAE